MIKQELKMNAQKIHIHVESDTVTIPELKEFIGRDVELIVLEVPKRYFRKEKFIQHIERIEKLWYWQPGRIRRTS